MRRPMACMKNPWNHQQSMVILAGKEQEFQNRRLRFRLLKIGYDQWLLTTIKKITNDLNIRNGINYEGTELSTASIMVELS